ncbi:recombination regulator RecX [Salipaludibacillus sp. CF4.18]|uniref:recombination regulator RecX n=1 Tax=Salipaludibacillus sp. CF4.18 TaxID=3373081 RepID=UPI003EE544E1
MPKITKITPAKKRKDRYHVYIDRGNGDEYALSVSEDILIQQKLWKDTELTEDRVIELRNKDEIDKAMQKTLNFLSYRMRSEVEIQRYLRDLEVDIAEEEISQMIDKLKKLDFLDDQRFAEAFVRTKRDAHKKGPLVIKQELLQKGVDKKIIEAAMEEYSKELQLDTAIKMVEKKQSSYKKEGEKKKEQKLVQFLIQRGFDQTTAYEAIRYAEIETDHEAEAEELAKQAEKAWKKHSQKDLWERKQRTKQYLYSRGYSMELIEKWFENLNEEE